MSVCVFFLFEEINHNFCLFVYVLPDVSSITCCLFFITLYAFILLYCTTNFLVFFSFCYFAKCFFGFVCFCFVSIAFSQQRAPNIFNNFWNIFFIFYYFWVFFRLLHTSRYMRATHNYFMVVECTRPCPESPSVPFRA